MIHKEFANWCGDQHLAVNQKYDKRRPYKFHLDQVYNVANRYLLLSPVSTIVTECACYSHDLIEDARITYNDLYKKCVEMLGASISLQICEITRAVTNYTRGRNREERMPDFIYEDIKTTPGATFIKLCDRIANVEYSVSTESNMVQKYKNENFHFQHMLYEKQYEPMFDHLVDLFNGK